MKKIVLLLSVFGLFLALLIGCEKDIDPPEPVPTKFIVEVEPTTDTIVYVGEDVVFSINTTADSFNLFTNTGFTKTFIGPGIYTFTMPIIKTGRNELFGYFFKEGYDRKTIDRLVIGKAPFIELYSIPYADEFPIPWLTSCSIKITSAGGDSLWTDLPGVNGAISGTFPTPVLDTTTTYHFRLFNTQSGDVAEANETIYVKDPTRADTLSNKCGSPWIYSGLAFSPDGVVWNIAEIRYCSSDNTQEFLPEGQVYMRYGEIRCGTEQDVVNPWSLSLNGEYLTIGDTNNVPFILHIEKITINTLEYTYHFPGFDITKETWIR